jgi:hypothetical protein
MAETIMKIAIFIMLLLCGIQDIIKKKVCIWVIMAGAFATAVCIPFCSLSTIPGRIGGIAVGVAVIAINLATAGKIGMGDAFLLCVTGLGLGFWGNLELFAIALLLAAIVSIILLSLRLADRKKSIPFIPFLFIGYLFILIADR